MYVTTVRDPRHPDDKVSQSEVLVVGVEKDDVPVPTSRSKRREALRAKLQAKLKVDSSVAELLEGGGR